MRCAILIDGPKFPQWASTAVEKLAEVCGIKNVDIFELCRNGRDSYLRRIENEFSNVRDAVVSLNAFGSLNFSFALNFGTGEVPVELFADVPFGIWFYRFGRRPYNDDNFGLSELWKGQQTQTVSLEQINAAGQRLILKEGNLKADYHSLGRHRASVLAQCENWPASVAEEIKQTGTISALEPPLPPAGEGFESASFLQVGLTKALLIPVLSFRAARTLAAKVRRIFLYQQWNIGLLNTAHSVKEGSTSAASVAWLLRPEWPLCYADPFLVFHDQKPYVFAERYDFNRGKGTISVLPIQSEDPQADEVIAMDYPFHTSYPCLFEDGNRLYCVPETLASGQIAIYRCEKFPRIWNKIAIVASGGRYSDPTLFRRDGLWWIFATHFDVYSEGNSVLNAWYAEEVRGPWLPHRKNPIKCDVTGSRSAGNPYYEDGILYRPTQDCSRGYGGSIVIQKMETLTTNSFKEAVYGRILPTKEFPDGCHHLSSVNGVTLIDGRRDRYSFYAPFSKLPRYFRSLRRTPVAKRGASKPKLVLAELPLGITVSVPEK